MPAIIALCLLVEARGISLLCGEKIPAGAALVIFAAFCNFGNGGMFLPEGVRSTSYLYVREIINPPNTDPFGPTAEWMKKNIPFGALVHVVPNPSLYPLMFLHGHVFYSWQLAGRAQEQFKDILPVFIRGESTPDFVIVFGQRTQEANYLLTKYCPPNTHYREVAKLDIDGNEHFRPEIDSHIFLPVSGFPDDRKVRIYQREGFDPAQIPNNPALRLPVKAPPPAAASTPASPAKDPPAVSEAPKQ